MTPNGAQKPILLLVIDDEQSFLDLTTSFLSQIAGDNLVITCLNNPVHFLKSPLRDSYDVIVSDYQMPQMSGAELLRQLRSTGNITPFIICTGEERTQVLNEVLDAGTNFCIQKQLRADNFFKELFQLITKAHAKSSKSYQFPT